MADWISLREFSRRRGVTLQAVQKAIAAGRVTAVRRNDAGRLIAIDADLAAEQWNVNTDPELALRTGTVVPAPGETASLPLAAETVAVQLIGGSDDGPDADNFRRDRAENERIKRINGELDLAERLKHLGKLEDCRRAGLDAAMQAQDALMRLPERLAPLLAAETDPMRVHALLAREIRVVLDGLSERARKLAAA